MAAILLGIFSFIMVLLCIFVVFVILMQRPNADAGMGASLGGGAAESAFGGETSNILTKVTVKCIVWYFILGLCLYLGYIYASSATPTQVKAPTLEAVTQTQPAVPAMPKTAPVENKADTQNAAKPQAPAKEAPKK